LLDNVVGGYIAAGKRVWLHGKQTRLRHGSRGIYGNDALIERMSALLESSPAMHFHQQANWCAT
jgi:hypothetical protein